MLIMRHLLLYTLTLVLFCVSPQKAHATIRSTTLTPFPIQLIWEEKEGVIELAFIRTPVGSSELPLLREHIYIGTTYTRSNMDDDTQEDLIAQVTFQHAENTNSGLQLWIGALSDRSTAWVASTPIARTKWDKIPMQLVKPKGSALYISPKTPEYQGSSIFEGEDALSFIYLVYLTKEGFSILQDQQFYKLIIPTLQIAVNSEYEPMKRHTYTKMLTDMEALSSGMPPSSPVIRNFNWRKILNLKW